MNDKTKLVVAGWLLNSAASSLYQDALGLEKYLATVALNWVDAYYTVPLAIVVLAVAALTIRTSNPKHQRSAT